MECPLSGEDEWRLGDSLLDTWLDDYISKAPDNAYLHLEDRWQRYQNHHSSGTDPHTLPDIYEQIIDSSHVGYMNHSRMDFTEIWR